MNERELFQRTFDKLHASSSVEKEILAMNETRRFHPLRPVIAAAACLTLMVCTAFAADAATGGAFFQSIRTVFGTQEVKQEVFHTNDFEMTAWTEISGGEDLPENAVAAINLGENAGAYLTEDGRVMLREKDREDQDVTEAWDQGGTFTAGGQSFTVEVLTDGEGNKLYECSGDREQETDVGKVFLNGGLLFDPDRFDMECLPGIDFGEMGDYSDYDVVDMTGSEESKVYSFTITEPEG